MTSVLYLNFNFFTKEPDVLERIYIGRRFRNDTERLEKLFELYTKMTATSGSDKKRKAGASS